MKKIFLLCSFSCWLVIGKSQALFTYGKHTVSAEEFLKAYNKNKSDSGDSPQAMRAYLDLYINYKLKSQAARDMRLDTLSSMKADVRQFRSQILSNYLTDQGEIERLTKEAFQRSQRDIHIKYYVLESLNADSANFLSSVKTISARIASDPNASAFSKIKLPASIKMSVIDPGYVTAFTLPYSLENVVYSLEPDEVSMPVQWKHRWYIFENDGERKAVGKITVSQILIAVPQGATSGLQAAKTLADSVYDLALNGADFAELAKTYSDDRSTYMDGGLMQEFGTSKYDTAFENHAFSLKKNGQISRPFRTAFGYHILKRIGLRPVPADSNYAYLDEVKQEVLADSRSELAAKKFVEKIRPLVGLKKNDIDENALWRVSDSTAENRSYAYPGLNANTVLVTFNDNAKITVADWISYLQKKAAEESAGKKVAYQKTYQDFIDKMTLENYASGIEHFDPRFNAQLAEFVDGNMLFDVMQKEVWQKASEDTGALRAYYEKNREKYVWNRSAAAVIFSCNSLEVARNAISQLKRRVPWRTLVEAHPDEIQADSGRFDLGQIPVVDRTNFTDGLITAPVVNKSNGSAVFAQIITVYPEGQQRKFDDARGLVINDFQNFLESKWLEKMKEKYPVHVNETVLQTLINKTYH